MLVHGPNVIHQKMNKLGLTNDLSVIQNGGHVSYYEKEWRDSVSNRVYNHLFKLICR